MIKVYSKPNCMQCEFTKKYLDDNNVEYVSVDINAEPGITEYLKDQGYQSMPVVEYKNVSFTGFRPDKLAEIVEELHNEKNTY